MLAARITAIKIRSRWISSNMKTTPNNMSGDENDLNRDPVQRLPFDFVIVFLFQFKLTVNLAGFVQNLCKACALEDSEQDRHNAVAEETANVGVHSHPAQEPFLTSGVLPHQRSGVVARPRDLIVHLANAQSCDYCQAKPCKEHNECVEVEISLALRLCLVVSPDHRQHRHAL